MMAARSRLSDFLRLLLETNFCSQLLEPSSLPKQLQQTIVEHSGTRLKRNRQSIGIHSGVHLTQHMCRKLTL